MVDHVGKVRLVFISVHLFFVNSMIYLSPRLARYHYLPSGFSFCSLLFNRIVGDNIGSCYGPVVTINVLHIVYKSAGNRMKFRLEMSLDLRR